MAPGEFAEIIIPALVTGTGQVKVSADLIGFDTQSLQFETLAMGSYTSYPLNL
jgi:hypothetical protein